MTLRVAALMQERGITAYALARDSHGRISRRTAYRLAAEEKAALYPDEIAALCDVLAVEPAELFEFKRGGKADAESQRSRAR